MGLLTAFQKLFFNHQAESSIMAKLDGIDAGHLPKNDTVRLVTDINKLISAFNKTLKPAEKKVLLKQMQQRIQTFNNSYPQSYFEDSPAYRVMYATLFKEIKHQYAKMGVHSLHDPKLSSSTLSEIIANMSPEIADALLKILYDGKKEDLSKLLSKLYSNEDQGCEAKNFRKFLRHHTINYLGGNNSKNFKVTNTKTGSNAILKVDFRFDSPKKIEASLHANITLRDNFTPIHTERQAYCKTNVGQLISRTLVVTDYCSGGSMIEQRKCLSTTNEIHDNALNLFQQMANIFQGLQKAGYIFPDAKASNWLVKHNGKLCIADTKSFLFTDNSGNYSRNLQANKYAKFIYTDGYRPPEFSNMAINADSTHAFILGKNLYRYLSNTHSVAVNAQKLDFNSEVFQTPKGRAFRELIEDLVKPVAKDRISVASAQEKLTCIQNLNHEFCEIIAKLELLKFGTQDPQIEVYIDEKVQQILTAPSNKKAHIFTEMRVMIKNLQKNNASNEMRTIIENYRKNSRWYTIGMHAKATRIEQAMSRVPLKYRANLLNYQNTKEVRDVMKALASHRHFGKRREVYLNKNGSIDLKKAANGFKLFDKKFNLHTPKNKKPANPIPRPKFK